MNKNALGNVKFFCIRGHEKPVEMHQQEGSSTFLACPKYYDDKREKGEPPCFNKVRLIDCEEILFRIVNLIEDENNFGRSDFTGYHSVYNKINFRVLKHTDKDLWIGLDNRKGM